MANRKSDTVTITDKDLVVSPPLQLGDLKPKDWFVRPDGGICIVMKPAPALQRSNLIKENSTNGKTFVMSVANGLFFPLPNTLAVTQLIVSADIRRAN